MRRAPALGVLAMLVSWTGRSAGAEPCRVAATGLDTPEWQQAIHALGAEIAGADCATVYVEATPDGARVVFDMPDGRRAERSVERPDELVPTVAALRVTVPSAPARPSDVPAQREPRPVGGPAEPAPGRDAGALFALQGGARGGADNLISPVLAGSAALALQRWEIGVIAAFDFQYFEVGGAASRAPGSAFALGVVLGRREPLLGLAALAGGRLMIAGLNDETVKDEGERGRAELRAGGYVGLAAPRRGSPRFRATLAVDVVPHDLGGSSGESITPWWAVSTLLGLELGGS